ncbi:pseudouridine synthase [Chloroflexota bacterium]
MTSESLLKVLTGAGVASRRRLTDVIKQGRVKVNGVAAESFNHPVDQAKDRITIDGKAVDLQPGEPVCLMLNKPPGVVTTASDDKGRPIVLTLIPGKYRHLRLHPVGRLDRDTTGLLLLTNIGELTYRLTHPRYEYEKEYLFSIKGKLKPGEMKRLESGVRLEDGLTRHAVIKEVTLTPPFNYSLTIHEGRKRQVRRMLAALGHMVAALKRVRVGSLTLGSLKEGETRELSRQEIKRLLEG